MLKTTNTVLVVILVAGCYFACSGCGGAADPAGTTGGSTAGSTTGGTSGGNNTGGTMSGDPGQPCGTADDCTPVGSYLQSCNPLLPDGGSICCLHAETPTAAGGADCCDSWGVNSGISQCGPEVIGQSCNASLLSYCQTSTQVAGLICANILSDGGSACCIAYSEPTDAGGADCCDSWGINSGESTCQ